MKYLKYFKISWWYKRLFLTQKKKKKTKLAHIWRIKKYYIWFNVKFPLPINKNWTTLKHFNHIASRKRSPSPISFTQKYRRFKRQWFPLNAEMLDSWSRLKNRLHGSEHRSHEIYNNQGLVEKDNFDRTMFPAISSNTPQ